MSTKSMIKAEIKCQTCDEIVGILEKDDIDAEDVAKYRQSIVCSRGHNESFLNIIVPPNPPPKDPPK